VKILHVEGGRNFYGGAHQILLLMEGLKARGIENALACRTGSDLAKVAAPLSEVHAIRMEGDLDVGLIRRLYQVIRLSRPDVVHLHSRIGADVMGGIAGRLAGVPVIHSRRQDNPESRMAVALKYRLHDRVIAISEAIGHILLSEGLPASKLRCVQDAVEITPRVDHPDQAWFRKNFAIPEGAHALGVVAQLIERKGHSVLIDAMAKILAQFPETRVFFFGKGPLDDALNAAIRERGLEHRVHLAGFRNDLERVLPCLDLVVHPAHREGMGVSLLQASLAEVPIVATAVGGIPEAVKDGVTGVLVPPKDPDRLAAAILGLLEDPERRRQLGKAGRQWVENGFSADRMVEGNLSVYREFLGKD
jgi:glycosyltransferase involved in cell wall biosynthesis